MALTFFKPWIRASKKKQTDEEEEGEQYIKLWPHRLGLKKKKERRLGLNPDHSLGGRGAGSGAYSISIC